VALTCALSSDSLCFAPAVCLRRLQILFAHENLSSLYMVSLLIELYNVSETMSPSVALGGGLGVVLLVAGI